MISKYERFYSPGAKLASRALGAAVNLVVVVTVGANVESVEIVVPAVVGEVAPLVGARVIDLDAFVVGEGVLVFSCPIAPMTRNTERFKPARRIRTAMVM